MSYAQADYEGRRQRYAMQIAREVREVLARFPEVYELGFDIAYAFYDDQNEYNVDLSYVVVNEQRIPVAEDMGEAARAFHELVVRHAQIVPEGFVRDEWHRTSYWLAAICDFDGSPRFNNEGLYVEQLVHGEPGVGAFAHLDDGRD